MFVRRNTPFPAIHPQHCRQIWKKKHLLLQPRFWPLCSIGPNNFWQLRHCKNVLWNNWVFVAGEVDCWHPVHPRILSHKDILPVHSVLSDSKFVANLLYANFLWTRASWYLSCAVLLSAALTLLLLLCLFVFAWESGLLVLIRTISKGQTNHWRNTQNERPRGKTDV